MRLVSDGRVRRATVVEPPSPLGRSSSVLLEQILAELRQANKALASLRTAVIEAPRPRTSGVPMDVPVFIRKVTVDTSGTPVQGPDQEIPPGWTTTVLQRRHTGTVNGRLAFSLGNVKVDDLRLILRDGDSRSFNIRNLNWLWFDSDTNGTNFEILVEVAV